jgi:DNA-binding transcriptional ArsR family regulator
MSDSNKKKFDPKDRRILYDFWNSLPRIKFVKDADKVYYSHKLRELILKALGEGIKEVTEISAEKAVIRRALSAQEIYHRIEDYKREKREIQGINWNEFDVSLHNLYFHMQKLEDADLIQTVTILREGRHNVSYYGRTAQVFFFRIDYEEYEKIKNAFKAMAKLAPIINPDLKPEDIHEFYSKYVEIGQSHSKKLFESLADLEKPLQETDVDPGDIANFIELLLTISPEFVSILQELTKKLGLNL